MHDFTVGPSDYAALELSKWDNLYYCIGPDAHLLFHFYPAQPTEACNESEMKWTLVQDFRRNASSAAYVDNYFSSSMSMVTPTPAGTLFTPHKL